jgi:hypothetical protein
MKLSAFTKIILCVFVLICGLWIVSRLRNHSNESLYQEQLSGITLPPSCTLDNKGYNSGDLTNPARLVAQYSCNEYIAQFNKPIEDSMSRMGYAPTQNNLPEVGSYEYRKDKLVIDFRLMGDDVRTLGDDAVINKLEIYIFK